MAGRKPTAEELAELEGSDGGRAPTAQELAELSGKSPAPAGPGPLRDNPTFSTTPPAGPAPGVPHLPPVDQLPATPERTTTAGAAALGAAQGLSGGFLDEATASMATYGVSLGSTPNPAPYAAAATRRIAEGDPTGLRTYRGHRDEMRELDRTAAAEHPIAHGTAQLGGAILSPLSKVGSGAGAIGRVIGGGAQAGVASAGASEADATRGEVIPLLKDTGKGAALGVAIGTAAEGGKAIVKGVAKAVTGDLKRRILNEVAEGTANVSQTERKRLELAGDAIVKEVTSGPDAKVVRNAYSGKAAAQGVESLGKVINEVADRNAAHYDDFTKAGRGKVLVEDYLAKLDAARKAAFDSGDHRLAKGLEPVRKAILETAKESGGLTVQRLRALTTQAQETAANALGSLLERQNAKVARRVQGVVTEAMDDTLTEAAQGVKHLETAAGAIRENNKRLHALLTINDALEVRARKEGSLPGVLVRGAKKLATPGVLAGAGALAAGDENRIPGMVGGAALGLGAVPLARAAERGLTTMGIKATQNPQAVAGAARYAGAIGRIGGSAFATKRKREEETQP